jgi:hypothetical protein
MKYLPFENITYKTKLDSDKILKRINEITEPQKIFRKSGIFGSTNYKPYEGYIDGMSFKITRITGYRNSFLPKIEGIIKKSFHETTVNVKMRLHPFVLIFMSIWCGGVGLGFLAVLNTSINKGNFEPIILIPLGMLLFGYGLTTGGFKYESIKSKKYLAQLFETEIEK